MLAKRAQVDEEELTKDDEVMCTCLSTASIGVRPVFLLASSIFPTQFRLGFLTAYPTTIQGVSLPFALIATQHLQPMPRPRPKQSPAPDHDSSTDTSKRGFHSSFDFSFTSDAS